MSNPSQLLSETEMTGNWFSRTSLEVLIAVVVLAQGCAKSGPELKSDFDKRVGSGLDLIKLSEWARVQLNSQAPKPRIIMRTNLPPWLLATKPFMVGVYEADDFQGEWCVHVRYSFGLVSEGLVVGRTNPPVRIRPGGGYSIRVTNDVFYVYLRN